MGRLYCQFADSGIPRPTEWISIKDKLPEIGQLIAWATDGNLGLGYVSKIGTYDFKNEPEVTIQTYIYDHEVFVPIIKWQKIKDQDLLLALVNRFKPDDKD